MGRHESNTSFDTFIRLAAKKPSAVRIEVRLWQPKGTLIVIRSFRLHLRTKVECKPSQE